MRGFDRLLIHPPVSTQQAKHGLIQQLSPIKEFTSLGNRLIERSSSLNGMLFEWCKGVWAFWEVLFLYYYDKKIKQQGLPIVPMTECHHRHQLELHHPSVFFLPAPQISYHD